MNFKVEIVYENHIIELECFSFYLNPEDRIFRCNIDDCYSRSFMLDKVVEFSINAIGD